MMFRAPFSRALSPGTLAQPLPNPEALPLPEPCQTLLTLANPTVYMESAARFERMIRQKCVQ